MASSVTLRVFRGTPDEAQGLAEYRVAAAADTTVLDALVEVQRAQDPGSARPGPGQPAPALPLPAAALNRVLTLELDHRDDGGEARWRVLLGEDALARCHGQDNCTEVCPMGPSPTDSIRRLRRLAVSRLLGLSR